MIQPSLQLQFARTKQLDHRITFTRNTGATYYDHKGRLSYAAAGEPRFDHDPATLASKGLLIEEARTNELTYSEQFDNAAWSKFQANVTPNAATAPDGTVTADAYSVTVAYGGTIYNSATVSAETVYTFSFYAKGFVNYKLAVYDVSNATFIVQDAATTEVFIKDGWYRIIYTFTTPTGCTSARVYPDRTGANTGETIYLWGAQLEEGSYPTSYMPTTAATFTRAADNYTSATTDRAAESAVMTGSNFSEWYRQDEGTFVVEGDANSGTNDVAFFTVDDGTGSNRIRAYRSAITLTSAAQITVSGTSQFASSSVISGDNKLALAIKANDYAFTRNGAAPDAETGITVPTVDLLRIGSSTAGGIICGHIKSLSFYPARLTDAQLQALTS